MHIHLEEGKTYKVRRVMYVPEHEGECRVFLQTYADIPADLRATVYAEGDPMPFMQWIHNKTVVYETHRLLRVEEIWHGA